MRKIKRIYFLLIAKMLLLFTRNNSCYCYLKEDIECWLLRKNITANRICEGVAKLLNLPEFCSVVIYRLREGDSRCVYFIFKLLLTEQCALFINTPKIGGGGLYIMHGFATIISAKSIGSNFTVYQNVTIGHTNAENHVVIGDNVTAYASSVIIGGITIGDNAEIGAGAVVVKDVEPNAIVVGNPQRVLKYKVQ